jgi:hypothetical protein
VASKLSQIFKDILLLPNSKSLYRQITQGYSKISIHQVLPLHFQSNQMEISWTKEWWRIKGATDAFGGGGELHLRMLPKIQRKDILLNTS